MGTGGAVQPLNLVGPELDHVVLVGRVGAVAMAQAKVSEGETLAAPVATVAEADHLARDGVAGLGLPLPDALFEFFAAQVMPVDAFLSELALHHHLGGDARTVGAGQLVSRPRGSGAWRPSGAPIHSPGRTVRNSEPHPGNKFGVTAVRSYLKVGGPCPSSAKQSYTCS